MVHRKVIKTKKIKKMATSNKPKSARLLKRTSFSKPQLLIFIIIFATIGGCAIYRSFAATPANVYVSTTGNDSTCVRGDQTKPCVTFNKAYELASPGDTVQVACGTYGAQKFTTRKSSGAQIVFQPATDFCATTGGWDFSNGGDYATYRDFNVVQRDGAIYKGNPIPGHNVYIIHNHINVKAPTDESIINIHAVDNYRFIDNTIGPSCCGLGTNSPVGMTFGIDSGGPNSTNVLVEGNLIQSVMRDCAYWPSTYELEGVTGISAGSCPSATCHTADPTCHEDGIHIWGLQNSTITRNRIIDVEVQGIFIEDTGTAVNSNLTITNNFVSVDGGNCGICINARVNAPSISGAWTIAFNSTPHLISILEGAGGSVGTTTFNIVGNIGQLYIPGGGCQGFADSNVSATYSYNIWEPVNGGTDTPCGTGDTTGNPVFVNALTNLHLTSSNHLVPASICTAITTTDIDGQTRPANSGTTCDAGADEFGSGGTPTPIPGDLNSDGHVTITDLSILLSSYATTNAVADINHDNIVNILDLSILLSHYGA